MKPSFDLLRSSSRLALALLFLAWQVCRVPAVVAATPTNFLTLHSFSASDPAGNSPRSPLVQKADGDLVGLTWAGGISNYGGMFRVSIDGRSYSVVRRFGSTDEDGRYPSALIKSVDGKLYGVTARGGDGHGTAFSIEPDGTGYTVASSFAGSPGSASYARALAPGTDGRLYCVSTSGGPDGYGSVFRVERDGTGFQLLHGFDEAIGSQLPRDGGWPNHLIQGSDGALYGTTQVGGTSVNAVGTVFALQPDGSGYRVLRNFVWAFPLPPAVLPHLIEGGDQLLYGTAGDQLFRLSKDGTGYVVLRQFTSGPGENSGLNAGVTEGPDGRLYGMTSSPRPAIYRINRDGTGYEVVWRAAGLPGDGTQPLAPIIVGRDREFYGTTAAGGDLGGGTVFRFGHALGLEQQGKAVRLTLTGVPGWTYRLQRSTDLSSWAVLDTVTIPAGSAPVTYDDSSAPLPAGFYRLVLH